MSGTASAANVDPCSRPFATQLRVNDLLGVDGIAAALFSSPQPHKVCEFHAEFRDNRRFYRIRGRRFRGIFHFARRQFAKVTEDNVEIRGGRIDPADFISIVNLIVRRRGRFNPFLKGDLGGFAGQQLDLAQSVDGEPFFDQLLLRS